MGLSKRTDQEITLTHDQILSDILPRQQAGRQSTVTVSRSFPGTAATEEVYKYLKLLLLDVNHWHRYISGITAKFQLTDKDGRDTRYQAKLGDHFRIKIPGPGLQSGGGYDWTTVEGKQEISSGKTDVFYMTAVPSRNPTGDSPDIAHFLKATASTTFIALKNGKSVSLMIFSRNEVPNDDSLNRHDRLRNRAVGFFAGLAFSKWQWSKLAHSIMREGISTAQTSGESFLRA